MTATSSGAKTVVEHLRPVAESDVKAATYDNGQRISRRSSQLRQVEPRTESTPRTAQFRLELPSVRPARPGAAERCEFDAQSSREAVAGPDL